MFIYKITNKINNKCYIGLDTGIEKRKTRFKKHIRESLKDNPKSSIGKAIKKYNINNFNFEIIKREENLIKLINAEIDCIKIHYGYTKGYNNTRGGEFPKSLKSYDINGCNEIKKALSQTCKEMWNLLSESQKKSRLSGFKNWNIERWKNTSKEERAKMISHLYTSKVLKKRSNTLIKYWNNISKKDKEHRLRGVKTAWSKLSQEEYETRRKCNAKNSLLGTKKTSKKLLVKNIVTLEEKIYSSGNKFHLETGIYVETLITRTKRGLSIKNLQGWRIK